MGHNDNMTTRSELDRKLIAAVERLGRALRVARQHLATTHQLSVLQVQLVEHISENPSRRVGSLAEELDVTQPTISDALASLDDKGIIERESDPNDGRASIIALTESGTALATTLANELAPILDDNRTTNADDEATALHVLLEEIRRLQMTGVITINRSCFACQHYQPPNEHTPDGRCLLLNQTLLPRDLRVECSDHLALR